MRDDFFRNNKNNIRYEKFNDENVEQMCLQRQA